LTVIVKDSLKTLVSQVKPCLEFGAVSDYLPEFGKAGREDFAVAIDTGADELITAGNLDARFTVQSVVKVFTLLLALHHRGKHYVFKRVGCDQGVGSYNSLETFIRGSGVPVNPFVNAGALVVVDMLPGVDDDSRVTHVVDFVRTLTGNPLIEIDMGTAQSEFVRADRNRALAYFLRSHGVLSTDVDVLLWAYCQMCAIQVGVADLARASRILAGGSDVVINGEILDAAHLRLVRRLMLIAGMYEASGQYACEVGIPAKCGVSGSMIGVVPRHAGVGIYGPALDSRANSLGGLRFMRLLAATLDLD